MNKVAITSLLKEYNQEEVEKYAAYIIRLSAEKDKSTGQLKNAWILPKTDEQLAQLYKRVANEKLIFDGVHITLTQRGIQYDYIAYKNKMLIAYPESKIDIQVVYKTDDFKVSKESGSVIYTHNIGEPFSRKEIDIVGGYCVIKNARGEFLTILNKEEFEKHKKIAKTKYIWDAWYVEMCYKTLMKKAVKYHFDDIYKAMEEEDNQNYDLELSLELEDECQKAIKGSKTVEELSKVYNAWKDKVKNTAEFNKIITTRKNEIQGKGK